MLGAMRQSWYDANPQGYLIDYFVIGGGGGGGGG